MSPRRPYILSEATWPGVTGSGFKLAVLPWGATEAHNRHLPYGTDTYQCDHIAAEAGRRAWEQGARAAILPTVPFGVNAGQLEIPMTLHVGPATQASILADIASSLEGQGFFKLVILNGHGGNDFRAMIRELQASHPRMFVSLIDWYRILDWRVYFSEAGEHAGELETSLMLHLEPGLVAPLDEAGPGTARRISLSAHREGWAWAPRHWPSTTEDTGVGNPSQATAGKGADFFDAVCDRIASYLVELSGTDLDNLYA